MKKPTRTPVKKPRSKNSVHPKGRVPGTRDNGLPATPGKPKTGPRHAKRKSRIV